MKQIFTLALAITALALTSCEDNKNQKLDPNAVISLRPDMTQAANVEQGAATKANPEHLSAIEIVKQTAAILLYNNEGITYNRGFADAQRDTIAPRLMMWGIDIISGYGEYVPTFIEGSDIVLVRVIGKPEVDDTIAYVPNSVLRSAQPLIKAAFDAGDYATCYDLFDKAIIFRPITGAEWRELKAQGRN